ncbi:CheY-like chemotaxis protein [Methanohalophilus levihalophilus]|uniref:response regulator n=1 Tax=Methanohalophilus levihalophilus TaxID=1431282 RepID=UPI001AE11CB9|nr:response regulator [Methanohalophilus levihalophilus]MBP2029793.1 CheY-like chemotaxis protein [Methanohalophilus levihalophilus]
METARILIVEDEAIVAMVIKKRLLSLGYVVSGVAASGNEAITRVEGTYPDLILMDILLKGDMDGIEAAGIIKERFNVPIVFLTAHSDDKTLERAKQVDPYGYIIKPFTEKDLSATIEIALHRHRSDSEKAFS